MSQYDITKDDPNFITNSDLPVKNVRWINCQRPPIEIFGLAHCQGDEFWRMPPGVKDTVNAGVSGLATHTAGARIRFRTDSPYVALRVKLLYTDSMSHMPLTGKSGCDIYLGAGKNKIFYKKTAIPASVDTEAYEAICCKRPVMEDVTVNLPLYNGVKAVYIGISNDAELQSPTPYTVSVPIVYYGSSITQGGCASRPGNSYQAILSRWLDADYINLGFSGSARGEENMAHYIKGLNMSVFVYDYDHNAPTAEHLEKTHEKFFRIIAEANPNLPVIMASRCDFESVSLPDNSTKDSEKCREIIRRTYENAKADGYKNVWFVDGQTFFGTRGRDSCTVDGCHPNDLGFMRIAEGFYPYIKEALNSIGG
jgi:hypothetical protein